MVVSTIIALYLLQQNIYEDGFVGSKFLGGEKDEI